MSQHSEPTFPMLLITFTASRTSHTVVAPSDITLPDRGASCHATRGSARSRRRARSRHVAAKWNTGCHRRQSLLAHRSRRQRSDAIALPLLDRIEWAVFATDSLAIGIYSILGADKALLLGVPPVGALLVGVLAGTGGSLLGDLIVGVPPVLF